MSVDRRSPQPPAGALGSSGGHSSVYADADDTLSGHASRSHGGSANVQHSARVSRGLGAAGPEILSGSSERGSILQHHERGAIVSSSKEMAPIMGPRMSTPTNAGSLYVDSNDDMPVPPLV